MCSHDHMSGLMEVTQFKANTMLSYMTQFHDDCIFFQTTVIACDWEYLLTKSFQVGLKWSNKETGIQWRSYLSCVMSIQGEVNPWTLFVPPKIQASKSPCYWDHMNLRNFTCAPYVTPQIKIGWSRNMPVQLSKTVLAQHFFTVCWGW
jgi:hypothetical protein